MRNGVEGLGEIQGHDGGEGRGFMLVKPPGYGLSDWKERSGCGPHLTEAMLRFREIQVRAQEREQQPLEDLYRG